MTLPESYAGGVQASPTSPSPIGFGYHTIYAGPKYDEMVSWYAKLLCLEPRSSTMPVPAGLLASTDSDTIVIARRDDLEVDDRPFRTGVFHIAWSYSSLAELMTVYLNTKRQGIVPQSVLNTGILLQFYYVDPEGNFLEFEVDAHETSEATQEAQRSGTRDVELKHWAYDPDFIVELMQEGWSDQDILNHRKFHAAKAANPADRARNPRKAGSWPGRPVPHRPSISK